MRNGYMKRASGFFVLSLLAVATVLPARAAEGDPTQGYIAGGYSQALGDAGDSLNGGWNLSGGLIWSPNPEKPIGLRFDLGFNTWDATTSAIQSIPGNTGQALVDGGYANMWTLTARALFPLRKPDHAGGHLVFGVG